MKKLFLSLVLLASVSAIPCRAQSTGDLIEQLVLDYQKLQDLKSILQDMYKGYQILDKGYIRIKNIARGQFDLHKAFLDGLLAVSPAVRNYYRIAAILDAEYNLVKEYKAASGRAHASGVFTGAELVFIDGVYALIFNKSRQSIDELTVAVTDGELRMSDAQRLGVIDRVYADIEQQLSAVRQLNNETSVQTLQRQHALNELKTLKKFYENP